MKFISHRGNINGIIPNQENRLNYIDDALSQGYDVEVDIWGVDGLLYTGHDSADYDIDIDWILDRANYLWIHVKNIKALDIMMKYDKVINYFWHQNDDVTLTSRNFIWTFPGKELTVNSIAVLPEVGKFHNISSAYGICSDFISLYKKQYD